MAGLKSGSVPLGPTAGHGGTVNRYVGFSVDWNMAKDVYEKQDPLNEFEGISMKWVRAISNSPPSDAREIYHGQRMLVGTSPTNGTDFEGQANKLAQYNQNKSTTNKWEFSRAPEDGDLINNLDDAKVWQYNGSTNAWEIIWTAWRTTNTSKPDYINPATPFHICKDIYKVRGFEGTPNSAIEARYCFDITGKDSANNSHYANRNLTPSATVSDNEESRFIRKNSRGAWLWFWNPFPRISHADNGQVYVGDQYGGNGTTANSSGFTTLSTYNLNTDKKQSLWGWNNGLNTEDMGRISSISFKLKVGVYDQTVDRSNDNFFWELDDDALVFGVPKIPMTFWAIDMFDRIWYKKFELRRNGYWDEVTIQFGDMSQHNLYLPRFDELWNVFGRPLGFTNYALKQREYTGVAFDWRFVRGWGVQWDAAYDDNGYYNGGFDDWWDTAVQWSEQTQTHFYNLAKALEKGWIDFTGGNQGSNATKDTPLARNYHRQATIAIDGLHYDKELVANSDDDRVENARTHIAFYGDVDDYNSLKVLAKGKKERLSFYPQFWHLRTIGDVRMRVGKSFKTKSDRMPNLNDMDTVSGYNSGTGYAAGAKVRYPDNDDGYVWESRQGSNQNHTPNTTNKLWWTNLNELACAEVKHIIDHTGYHMEVRGRRKFLTVGD
jgi:hypothetical protein